VVLDDFRDESIECAAAGGRLLQDHGALVVRIDGALDCFELTAHAFARASAWPMAPNPIIE
jgi:hypothetical protein